MAPKWPIVNKILPESCENIQLACMLPIRWTLVTFLKESTDFFLIGINQSQNLQKFCLFESQIILRDCSSILLFLSKHDESNAEDFVNHALLA